MPYSCIQSVDVCEILSKQKDRFNLIPLCLNLKLLFAKLTLISWP